MGLPVHSLETFKYLVGEGREEMVRKSLPQTGALPLTGNICSTGQPLLPGALA
jgi:hypothetical protein